MREGADPSLSNAPTDAAVDDAASDRVADAAVGEASWALPLLGAVLLVSPLIRIAADTPESAAEGGAVLTSFLYIFVCWGGLILLAARLARRADRAERRAREMIETQRRAAPEDPAA